MLRLTLFFTLLPVGTGFGGIAGPILSVRGPAQQARPDSSERTAATSILLAKGFEPLDEVGHTFRLKPGLRLTLSYVGDRLVDVEVDVGQDYVNAHAEAENKAGSSYRFAFDPELRAIRELVDELRPIGPKSEIAPGGIIGIVGPAGWVNRTEDHSYACVRVYARSCDDTQTDLGCGFREFEVSYWLWHTGRVERKSVTRTVIAKLPTVTEHWLVVGGRKFRVERPDYQRTMVGDTVCVRYLSGGQRASLVSAEQSQCGAIGAPPN